MLKEQEELYISLFIYVPTVIAIFSIFYALIMH
ncbi:hypothetical protein SDC9_180019 [bioreactor metagenome]|uniref:Uncharacterized protein n=1 Tax=bioreactor metagenome TaxID=1076179 RepID=A0A645H1K1_9ZZZZ